VRCRAGQTHGVLTGPSVSSHNGFERAEGATDEIHASQRMDS
jgi:hypothetical protein